MDKSLYSGLDDEPIALNLLVVKCFGRLDGVFTALAMIDILHFEVSVCNSFLHFK